MPYVTFVDETTAGERSAGRVLDITGERTTPRELIRRRVRHEVAEYNAGTPRVFRGLVQPERAERVPGGHAMPGPGPGHVDADAQVERALRAFQGNGFLLLVGDRQTTELDEEIELTADTEVTFLRLVALVGG
ncbi:hypothetical protein [Streptomyces hainanensis]|uniref:Uncharacterized protein n=1 Tax=Streptomyces hainanensis TaxID=402648 RepID=A0A4R4TFT0_9ACTN|nr:hypothetical protein [Streptomyces hainanensis]TDC76327.1 hypothetical protein E1283_10065 [Streptomyces hainanensis]